MGCVCRGCSQGGRTVVARVGICDTDTRVVDVGLWTKEGERLWMWPVSLLKTEGVE